MEPLDYRLKPIPPTSARRPPPCRCGGSFLHGKRSRGSGNFAVARSLTPGYSYVAACAAGDDANRLEFGYIKVPCPQSACQGALSPIGPNRPPVPNRPPIGPPIGPIGPQPVVKRNDVFTLAGNRWQIVAQLSELIAMPYAISSEN